MSHINNKQMISKAISLKKNKIFQNSHYIHYSGTKVENFAAVVFAAFSLGHTVVLGKEKVTNDTIFDVHDEIISRAETKIEVLDLVRQIKRRQESDSIALITNTSGSTGTPKSIAFSYKSIINRVNEIITLYSLTNKTRELILLPITSTAIFFDQFLPVLFVDGYIEDIPLPFNPVLVQKALYQSFDYSGVTPTILKLLDSLKVDWNNVRVKKIGVGGEPIDFSIVERINKDRMNELFYPMYGMSETGGAIAGLPEDRSRPKDSVGTIVPSIKFKVDDGELLIQDSNLAQGRIEDGIVKNIIDSNGWFHTGDLVKVNQTGYMYILGRKKNIIITEGINIYPEEIENIVNRMDGIITCKVYGVADSMFGESLAISLVVSNDNFDYKKALQEQIFHELGSRKVPKYWNVTKKMTLVGLGKGRIEK